METPSTVTGPVNLGNPAEFTIRELAELVIALTGSSSTIVYRPLPQDDPQQRCPDITKARELLDWKANVPLSEGLLATITYFDHLLSSNQRGPSVQLVEAHS
jgi:UDP-glucuronate decarboxylase